MYITELYRDLITSVVTMLEAKDHLTADHSMRVSDMTERTCKALGLGQRQTESIHMAAHVHDIGKIGISGDILSKPGRLTESEWNIIREHPRIGANILINSEGLSEIAEIVLHHHERWDGKGYPDGLKGDHIPLGSRIIAICDSIDAMTSQRSYRKMISSEECRDEVARNSGIMYDPKIVKVVLREWDRILNRS